MLVEQRNLPVLLGTKLRPLITSLTLRGGRRQHGAGSPLRIATVPFFSSALPSLVQVQSPANFPGPCRSGAHRLQVATPDQDGMAFRCGDGPTALCLPPGLAPSSGRPARTAGLPARR